MNKHPDLNITTDQYIDKPVEELKDILTGIEASINEKRLRHIQAKQAEIAEKRKQQQQAKLLQEDSQEKIERMKQKEQKKIELIKQKQQDKIELMKQKQAQILQKEQEKIELMKQKQQQKKEQAINMKIERITQPDKPVANNFKPRQIKMKIM